jgi:hypothetical protein
MLRETRGGKGLRVPPSERAAGRGLSGITSLYVPEFSPDLTRLGQFVVVSPPLWKAGARETARSAAVVFLELRMHARDALLLRRDSLSEKETDAASYSRSAVSSSEICNAGLRSQGNLRRRPHVTGQNAKTGLVYGLVATSNPVHPPR